MKDDSYYFCAEQDLSVDYAAACAERGTTPAEVAAQVAKARPSTDPWTRELNRLADMCEHQQPPPLVKRSPKSRVQRCRARRPRARARRSRRPAARRTRARGGDSGDGDGPPADVVRAATDAVLAHLCGLRVLGLTLDPPEADIVGTPPDPLRAAQLLRERAVQTAVAMLVSWLVEYRNPWLDADDIETALNVRRWKDEDAALAAALDTEEVSP